MPKLITLDDFVSFHQPKQQHEIERGTFTGFNYREVAKRSRKKRWTFFSDECMVMHQYADPRWEDEYSDYTTVQIHVYKFDGDLRDLEPLHNIVDSLLMRYLHADDFLDALELLLQDELFQRKGIMVKLQGKHILGFSSAFPFESPRGRETLLQHPVVCWFDRFEIRNPQILASCKLLVLESNVIRALPAFAQSIRGLDMSLMLMGSNGDIVAAVIDANVYFENFCMINCHLSDSGSGLRRLVCKRFFWKEEEAIRLDTAHQLANIFPYVGFHFEFRRETFDSHSQCMQIAEEAWELARRENVKEFHWSCCDTGNSFIEKQVRNHFQHIHPMKSLSIECNPRLVRGTLRIMLEALPAGSYEKISLSFGGMSDSIVDSHSNCRMLAQFLKKRRELVLFRCHGILTWQDNHALQELVQDNIFFRDIRANPQVPLKILLHGRIHRGPDLLFLALRQRVSDLNLE